MPKLVTCSTLAECDAHDGERVEVIGVYQRYEMGFGKGRSFAGHVVIALGADGRGPLLERYWHAAAVRDPAELARYEGQRVVVVGRFLHDTPPNPDDPPHAARLSVPAIVDIDSIALDRSPRVPDRDAGGKPGRDVPPL
jgi:hypothetical protein